MSVPPGATLLDAATAAGLDVPTLCFHPNMAASANCRLCVVEQSLSPEWHKRRAAARRSLTAKRPSCCRPAAPRPSRARSCSPNSHNVLASRRGSLRLLLGGVDLSEAPELADLCEDYSLAVGTAAEREPFPIYVDNPYYIRDYNKCVMCWRCVDVCGDQVQFTFAIEPAERGFEVRVGTAEYDGMLDTTCVYCGNCVQVCPSGALKGRAQWEAERRGQLTDDRVVETTCSFCGVGCGLTAHVRDGVHHPRRLARRAPGQPGLAVRQGSLWLGLRAA